MKHLILALLSLLTLTQQIFAQAELPLRAGDQIGITVSGIPPEEAVSIKNNYRISDRGTISLLYLSDVRAAGMKPSELERIIEQLYKSKEIYTHPSVNISVDTGAVSDRIVYVNGEVTKVGQVPFRPGLTASRALASAGGPTPFGKPSKAKLIRRGQITILNLADTSKPDGQTLMEPDDELVVPD
jgi:polysaccharide export outer membrane protein